MNEQQTIVIFGAGGHAKVVIDIIRLQGKYAVEGIIDPITTLDTLYGIKIQPDFTGLKSSKFLVAIGDNQARKRIFEQAKLRGWLPVAAVHPQSVIASDVVVGDGTVVMANAVINPASSIGENCIINTGATIDHDCRISSHAHVAPGCTLAGKVTMEEGAFLGIGTRAIPGIKVGEWSQSGGGAVLIQDVPAHCTVVGVPARVIKKDERLEQGDKRAKGQD